MQPRDRTELAADRFIETRTNRNITTIRAAVLHGEGKRLTQIVDDVGGVNRIVLPNVVVNTHNPLVITNDRDGRSDEVIRAWNVRQGKVLGDVILYDRIDWHLVIDIRIT